MGINLPNGAEVGEIVLPDGSQASEVIGPDGSTVWERVAIPDAEGVHDYAPSLNETLTGSVDSISDRKGSLDLSGSASIGSINDVQTLSFNGADNQLSASRDTNLSQPFIIYVVVELQDNGSVQTIVDGSSNKANIEMDFSNDRIVMFGGSSLTASDEQTIEPVLLTAVFNGSNSELRKNGVEIASGDAGSDSLDGVLWGNNNGVDRPLNGDSGRLFYQDGSTVDTGFESDLIGFYSIT